MHHVLFVKDSQKLRTWCETLIDLENTRQGTGRILRSLHLGHCVHLTSEQLYTIQKTFPNIKHLYLQNLYINTSYVGTGTNWLIWKSLTELRIDFYGILRTKPDKAFIDTVSNLPLLRRLDFGGDPCNLVDQTLALSDFELLHTRLIHLSHLELSTNLLVTSGTEVRRMTEVLPAKKIKIFRMLSKQTDHRWLYYFARKYPNLEKLTFSTFNDKVESDKQKNDIIALLRNLTRPFQHLKTLHLGSVNYPHKEYLLFWDIITCCRVSLECIHVYSCNAANDRIFSRDLRNLPKVLIEICSTKFSETIKDLSFMCDKHMNIPKSLIKQNDVFCNLVHLKIRYPLEPFKLDDLLDKKIFLQSLTLFKVVIDINPDALTSTKRHALRLFEVHYSNLTSDILRYLSTHCGNLNSLHLIKTIVNGSINSTPGCQFIDLTYTRFKSLRLLGTCFILKDNPKSEHNLNIMLVTRPVEDTPPKNLDQIEALPIVIGGLTVKAHYHWLYADGYGFLKTLPKNQHSKAEKFFMQFEKNKEKALKTIFYEDKTRKPKINWKKNYVYGYTKIKCGYIANCDIDV
ncbi:hypothetical protein F4703DRAFT_1837607 [Phycomyces blakesleeanus]